MDQTPRIGLSYLAANQAMKHVTLNESLRRLDAVVQLSVVSQTIVAEPESPAPATSYILPDSKTGTHWAGFQTGAVASFQDGAWFEIAPREGWLAWIEDEASLFVLTESGWEALQEAGGGPFETLGINSAADTTNRLTVCSDAELLTHDDVTPGTGDARKLINRASATKVASVVFQTGFTGEAEFGLVENGGFELRTSSDGTLFSTALSVDTASTNVGVGGSPAGRFSVLDQSVATNEQPTLSVTRDGYFATAYLDTYADAATYSSFSIQRRARGSLAAPLAVEEGDWCGGFSFRGRSAAGDWAQRALVNAIVDGPVAADDVPMAMGFWTGAGGLAERMRLTSSGRVGIGTTTPTAALDVAGAVRVGAFALTDIPAAAEAGSGAMIYVADAPAGATLAYSDGSVWRDVSTRSTI
ncbi:DUF2793 domain-containing protein [Henriciella marina]|uniref:DUF2793 domain-containing protein n=1 Tax=Henriciella marina TaxID=453851 RepID=UPI0003767F20|nr:DUF2793 domain-containing protein [Henriciella marina]